MYVFDAAFICFLVHAARLRRRVGRWSSRPGGDVQYPTLGACVAATRDGRHRGGYVPLRVLLGTS